MKVLIIEDEPRAAHRLSKLIEHLAPDTGILATLESVRESVKFLSSHPDPDLIFSDIRLADGLSFEIYKQVKINCPIIFTTAYDHYAIEAFNTNGIDYLLKPIEEDRLKQALKKLKNLEKKPDLEKIMDLISKNSVTSKKYKTRFMVRVGEQIKAISSENIKVFYSFERATFILTKTNNNYIIDYSLDQLEEMLDPGVFFRVNRKHFVSLNACTQIYAWSNSRLKIEVDGLDDEVVVARERVNNFKEWLDG
ncbi:MAG: LytTR family DNA-binding domain-containing protein [Bacteroidales bacterium]|nr:LytTR family DNA-binding domain-containing protein [Bacteroidales bacterium]